MRARNGKIVADSAESYERRIDAERMLRRLARVGRVTTTYETRA